MTPDPLPDSPRGVARTLMEWAGRIDGAETIGQAQVPAQELRRLAERLDRLEVSSPPESRGEDDLRTSVEALAAQLEAQAADPRRRGFVADHKIARMLRRCLDPGGEGQ